MRPTEWADINFDSARKAAERAVDLLGTLKTSNGQVVQLDGRELGQFHLAIAVRELSKGLKHLSVGLRATYLALERDGK